MVDNKLRYVVLLIVLVTEHLVCREGNCNMQQVVLLCYVF